MLSIHPKDFWSMAEKAVKAYVNKKFAGYTSYPTAAEDMSVIYQVSK